jgi:cytochrome c553
MIKFLSLVFISAVALTSVSHAQDVKGDGQAGEKKVAMCIGCHGIKGYQASFPVVYKVPKIAGQSMTYIQAALSEYKKGERKNTTMRAIATSLSDKDMADVAAYYSALGHDDSLVLPPKATEPEGDVAALVAKGACTSCHGANLSMPIGPAYPKIAGQYADYLLVALRSYKADEGLRVWGRANGVMGGVAKQFSTDELKLLAKYVSEQTGELATVPQSRFR